MKAYYLIIKIGKLNEQTIHDLFCLECGVVPNMLRAQGFDEETIHDLFCPECGTITGRLLAKLAGDTSSGANAQPDGLSRLLQERMGLNAGYDNPRSDSGTDDWPFWRMN